MKRSGIIILTVIALCLIFGVVWFFFNRQQSSGPVVKPTPTPEVQAPQLPEDQQPKVSLQFSADAHYVTVRLTNVHADQLEYNLIYEATVKNNKIQTGVNASAKLSGATSYSQKQLLGSESSGKFTYHQDIKNAVLELALRDNLNRSVFTGTYPFTVSPGTSVDLSLQ